MKGIILLVFIAVGLLGAPRPARATQVCQNVVVGMQQQTPIFQQQCSWLAGGVAFDPRTRAFTSTWNMPSADEAIQRAAALCGAQCVASSFFEDLAYVALADDDSGYGTSTVSREDAVNRCQAASGAHCDAVIGASSTAAAIYWHYGAIAYDVESGKSGKSANRLYRADAVAKALAECGTPNCWAYGFQTGNGAIAKSADGSLFSGWSGGGGLFSSAARDAKKRCKQASGDRNCEVVIEGAALDTDIAIRDSEATLQRAKALIDGGR